MRRPNIKEVVLESALAIVKARGGSLTWLMREIHRSPADGTRLNKKGTNFGIDLVDDIAAKFRFQTWQLLVPGFNPASPPALASDDLMIASTPEEQALLRYFRELKDDQHRAAFLLSHQISVKAQDGNEPPQASTGEARQVRRKSGERQRGEKAA